MGPQLRTANEFKWWPLVGPRRRRGHCFGKQAQKQVTRGVCSSDRGHKAHNLVHFPIGGTDATFPFELNLFTVSGSKCARAPQGNPGGRGVGGDLGYLTGLNFKGGVSIARMRAHFCLKVSSQESSWGRVRALGCACMGLSTAKPHRRSKKVSANGDAHREEAAPELPETRCVSPPCEARGAR